MRISLLQGPFLAIFPALCPVLAVLASCGGQIGGEPERGDATGATTGADGGAASGATSGDTDEEELGPGDLELEECELGFAPGQDERPCNWIAENRCYETKAHACNCVCPRDGPSVCLSDFYGGEGSQTKVTCS